jgi:hypothetical protein
MNDVFYIFVGLEILTKMLKHVALFFICSIGFSFNANAHWLSHEVV